MVSSDSNSSMVTEPFHDLNLFTQEQIPEFKVLELNSINFSSIKAVTMLPQVKIFPYFEKESMTAPLPRIRMKHMAQLHQHQNIE